MDVSTQDLRWVRGLMGLLALGVIVVMTGCSSSGEVAGDERATQDTAAVEIDDNDRMRARRVEDLLVGRVSGVRVQQSARGIRVIIRGQNSIVGSSEPLYVVDGMPIEAAPGRALIGLNPRDIESIRVLKDPVDTSMYGMRGANGVVIIKTLTTSSRPTSEDSDDDSSVDA
ncbi:MAG: TonB-dependent receptor plug domain-containing protein [Bacteroidetes bacterium]|jgi:TonB-dependent SusC/RagA subfamily outer membrane receptor|nr:TonB-dependent receptor plug domain-containing protein [Bacteroidota bacterium]